MPENKERLDCKTVADVVAYLLPIIEEQGGYQLMVDSCPDPDNFITWQHHNLGQWIRNQFGFWGNPAMGQSIIDDALANYTMPFGPVTNHPDDISSVILFELWKKVKLLSDGNK
jgi:hypothetical protein